MFLFSLAFPAFAPYYYQSFKDYGLDTMSMLDSTVSLWDGPMYLKAGENLSDLYRTLGIPGHPHPFERICIDYIRQFRWHENGKIVPTRELRYAQYKDVVLSMAESLLVSRGMGARFWGTGSPDKVNDGLLWERDRRLYALRPTSHS